MPLFGHSFLKNKGTEEQQPSSSKTIFLQMAMVRICGILFLLYLLHIWKKQLTFLLSYLVTISSNADNSTEWVFNRKEIIIVLKPNKHIHLTIILFIILTFNCFQNISKVIQQTLMKMNKGKYICSWNFGVLSTSSHTLWCFFRWIFDKYKYNRR